MVNINVNGILLDIKGLVKTQDEKGVMFITDAVIRPEIFNDFLNLYKKHNKVGVYFNTVIDGQDFYGRFGQLIYSKGELFYNVRLVFVESTYDNEENYLGGFVSCDDVQYNNMVKTVCKQKLIIENLTDVLIKNGLLSKENVDSINDISNDEINDRRFIMSKQVDDLEKYLESIHDKLDDINK